MLGVSLWNKPKPVVTTQYVKGKVRIDVDKGTVERNDNGSFVASGEGIHLVDITSEFNQTKYQNPQWLIMATYSLDTRIDVKVGKALFSGVYVVGGISTKTSDLSNVTGSVGLAVTF
jgi:hypothetical protein